MRPNTGDHRRVSLHHWRESHFQLGFGVSCSFHDVLGLLTPGDKVLVLVNIGHHVIHFLHRKPLTANNARFRTNKTPKWSSHYHIMLENYPSILRSEYSFLLLVRLMKFLLWGTVDIVSQSWRQSTLGDLVIKMPHDDKCLKGKEETACKPYSRHCHKDSAQQKRPTTFQLPATKLNERTKTTGPGG